MIHRIFRSFLITVCVLTLLGSIQAQNSKSKTDELFKASERGDRETVEKLVGEKIDVNATSPVGLTAVQIAKMRGHDGIADFLVSKGAAKAEAFDAKSFIDSFLKMITPQDQPGISVLISRDGEILFSKGFGMANLADDIPITTKTKFRIGSVTKQFAGAAILKLQEDGKLDVKDKLSQYIPDYPRGDEVTIHHLLTHTSGIKSFTGKPDFYSDVAASISTEEMIDSFKNDKFDFDPGQKFQYNNSGYFLLGFIIEKVSGKSFHDYLTDTFFKPLGMNDTGVHVSSAVLKHEATGYAIANGEVSKALNWDMSRAGAAGNLYSTVGDLMKWNEGIFGGKVLNSESLKAAFTPVKLDADEKPSLSYGYGWMMDDHRGLQRISHSGGLSGWLAHLSRYVDKNVTVVAFHNALPSNPALTPGRVADQIAEAFLWQEMKPKPKYVEDKSVDPKLYKKYAGNYDYMTANMKVTVENKKLFAQLDGQPKFRIYPMGKHKFFWKVVDAQIEFLEDEDGNFSSAKHTQNGQTFTVKRAKEVEVVKVDTKTLDLYVGKYSYQGLGVLTVRRDGEQLLAQMTGQPEFKIYAKSKDEFAWKVVQAEIKFVLGEDGKVEKAIHKQGGGTINAKKIE